MQTVLITNDNENVFGEELNEVLKMLKIKGKRVIDIKFTSHSTLWGDSEHQYSVHSALILYCEGGIINE